MTEQKKNAFIRPAFSDVAISVAWWHRGHRSPQTEILGSEHITGRMLEFPDFKEMCRGTSENVKESLQYRAEFPALQEIQPCTVDFPSHFLVFPCTFLESENSNILLVYPSTQPRPLNLRATPTN